MWYSYSLSRTLGEKVFTRGLWISVVPNMVVHLKFRWSLCSGFCEILAQNYAPGTAAPGACSQSMNNLGYSKFNMLQEHYLKVYCSRSIFATCSWSVMHFKFAPGTYLLYAPGVLGIQIYSWSIFDLNITPDYSCFRNILQEQLLLEHNLGPRSHRSCAAAAPRRGMGEFAPIRGSVLPLPPLKKKKMQKSAIFCIFFFLFLPPQKCILPPQCPHKKKKRRKN